MEELEQMTEERAEPSIQERINAIEGEINGLRAQLANTDWCVIKCQETGESMDTLYPRESVARASARYKINSLQTELGPLYEALDTEKSATVELN